MMKTRRYSELRQLETFEDRFSYLRLDGSVGRSTFGFDRHINQKFYISREWQDIRRYVLLRDGGCDLGIEDYEIFENPIVHHMNPMVVDDILHKEEWILDPEFLITTCHETHNAIHYGADTPTLKGFIERSPGDTTLW